MKKSELKALIREVICEAQVHAFFVAYDSKVNGWHTIVRTSSAEEAKKIADKKYSSDGKYPADIAFDMEHEANASRAEYEKELAPIRARYERQKELIAKKHGQYYRTIH